MHYPKLVLQIDDDEEDYLIFNTALTACSGTVELIYEKSAIAALARLQDEAAAVPDMVLLDWYMPLVSGKDILAAIRQIPHIKSIPVILFSGSDPNLYWKEAEALGATYFLRKAAVIGDLQQKLEELFSRNWNLPL